MTTRSITTTGIALMMLSASLAASCRSGSPAAETTPATPLPSSAAPSPSAGPERDALTAYRGMWNAYVEAAKTSDPDAPDLRKYAADNALKLIVSDLYTDRDQGKVAKGEVALNPKIKELKPPAAPTTVIVEDCVDSTKWLEYKASGGLWDDKPGGKHRTTSTVTKQADETWKVSAFTLERSGTC